MIARTSHVVRRLACACALAGAAACGKDGGDAQDPAPDDGGTADDDAGSTRGSSDGPHGTSGAPGTTGSASAGTTSTGEPVDDPGIFDVGVIPDGPGGIVPQECDCAPGTDVIYVLSDSAELWSFDPVSLDFELISAFDCGELASTFSMGVDRNGIAWVMYQSADIYNIDVNNPLACVDPGYTPNQLGFNLFGMAFVSESADNPCDQLYANSYSGGIGFQEGPDIGRLGTVDPDDLTMSELGPTDYDGAELSGTGDGRLFAFAGVGPAKLVEFDKTDATVIDILPLDTLELTNAFAFAHYGGDFYFFTEGPSFITSQVTHIDYDDSDGDGEQQLEVVEDQAPIRIVGAGVSTCVPIIPPG